MLSGFSGCKERIIVSKTSQTQFPINTNLYPFIKKKHNIEFCWHKNDKKKQIVTKNKLKRLLYTTNIYTR